MRTRAATCVGGVVLIVLACYQSRCAFATGIPYNTRTWLLCRNPQCKHSYEITLRQYFQQVEAAWNAQIVDAGEAAMAPPGLKCPKCGELSCYEAVKCPKCGLVFEKGSVAGDYEDRCPKCAFSEIEVARKRRQGFGREGPTIMSRKGIVLVCAVGGCAGLALALARRHRSKSLPKTN